MYVRPDCARFSYARLYVALAFVRDDAFEFCRKNFYFVIVNIDFFLFHIIIDSISTLFFITNLYNKIKKSMNHMSIHHKIISLKFLK